jgi:oligopeptide/dipeptide ABC transporter ATP-binding protein
MALLEVDGLSVAFGKGAASPLMVVEDSSFTVEAGETVALVGESGSGKSMTALAVMGLLPPGGRIIRGHVRFDGRDLSELRESELAKLRGNRLAMVFQEPMASLNPLLTVGGHVTESLRLHRGLTRRQARAEAIALLARVGIPSPAERVDEYPHRLSGGMRQRVVIAAALACNPALLIADEPTTALDVTIQAQILDLLAALQVEFGLALLLITHDLGVVAEQAHRVVVMYAGRVVERLPAAVLLDHAAHPYTEALLRCIPGEDPEVRLANILGTVPPAGRMPGGCRFHPRCGHATDTCREREPDMRRLSPVHEAACVRVPA